MTAIEPEDVLPPAKMVVVFHFNEPQEDINMGVIIGLLKEHFQDMDDVRAFMGKGRAADYILEFFQTGKEVRSPLVEHAKKELELLPETDVEFKESIVKAIQGFVTYGHSGGSAGVAIHMIHDLLQGKNLSPLTDDPKEWMSVDVALWQSTRCHEAFSHDGGKTYYLLSEGGSALKPEPLHESEHKPKEPKD